MALFRLRAAVLTGVFLLLPLPVPAAPPRPPPGAAARSPLAPRAATALPVRRPETPPALPPESLCAGLPETGRVAVAAAPVEVPAVPTPERGFHCDAPFALDLKGRLPRCVRPGLRIVDGNPRAVCHAAMALGPLAPVAPRTRPTRSCEQKPAQTIVRLEGASIGWRDVAITAVPDRGITITTLADIGDATPEAESPLLAGCFAFDCRLVKLAIDASAAPEIELRAALPGRDYTAITIKLPAWCPR
jgi:hypothetical protein